jgi:hypothetical protein
MILQGQGHCFLGVIWLRIYQEWQTLTTKVCKPVTNNYYEIHIIMKLITYFNMNSNLSLYAVYNLRLCSIS